MHRLRKRRWCGWVRRFSTVVLTAVSLTLFAAEPSVTNLPPLVIRGKIQPAHTQGLEWVDGALYVTARLEDETYRQALLLRTRLGDTSWQVWNLTVPSDDSPKSAMDHPGGFQFDGRNLWIPVAESRRSGRSLVRVVDPKALRPGAPVPILREFPVADHIGAIAVAAEKNRVLGASWDTASIWVWDLQGTFVERLPAGRLRTASLGVDVDGGAATGLTVQDWKWHEGRLVASGLWKDGNRKGFFQQPAPGLLSRVAIFGDLPSVDVVPAPRWLELPRLERREIAREGMAIHGGRLWFLPDDLGATNRLYSLPESR